MLLGGPSPARTRTTATRFTLNVKSSMGGKLRMSKHRSRPLIEDRDHSLCIHMVDADTPTRARSALLIYRNGRRGSRLILCAVYWWVQTPVENSCEDFMMGDPSTKSEPTIRRMWGRRFLASTVVVPPDVAEHLNTDAMAVLAVIRSEAQTTGGCSLPVAQRARQYRQSQSACRHQVCRKPRHNCH